MGEICSFSKKSMNNKKNPAVIPPKYGNNETRTFSSCK
jgi:hypothetical protein